ncbi:MAG: peptidylprolyl isomerase [bacterium]
MRGKRFFFLLSAIVVSLLFFVHRDASLNATEKEGEESTQKHVIATVNGEPITLDDYYKDQHIRPSHLNKDMQNPKRIEKYLDRMIEEKLLEQEAIRLELNKDPAILQQIQDLKKRLLINTVRRKIIEESITDERIEQYYKEHVSHYTSETVRASHILVKTEDVAKTILKQLAEGKLFADLAKQYSIDPTAKKGGDLGDIARGKMAPEFDKALFKMKKKGEISPIVKTRFGYHIITLTGTLQKQTEPLDKVKNKIKREIKKDVMEKYLAELKAKAKVTIEKEYKEK